LIETADGTEGNFPVVFNLIDDHVVYDPTSQIISLNLPRRPIVEPADGSFGAVITLVPTP
jgi:hypothetical protein